MKISIENLGPLTHAEFDLKPLTVFIGDNRQGKTQALVVATTMLSDYGLYVYISHYLNNPDQIQQIPEIEQLNQDLITTSQAEINLVEFARKYLVSHYTNLGRLTPVSLANILGYTVPVEKTRMIITLPELEQEDILSRLLGVGIQNINPTAVPKAIKEQGDPVLHLYVDANQKLTLPKPAVINTLLGFIVGTLQRINLPSLYHFPSERAGFTLLLTEIQKLNLNQTPPQPKEGSQNIILPFPLSQYVGLVHQTLITGSKQQRVDAAKTDPNLAKILELHTLFTTITQDTINLSSPEPEFPRKVQIQVHDTVLDVQAASSGVKGLIGLSLYLQYKAQPGDLIVIDEPEQNLHPNQQAAFVEFLALLVNNGIRVAITTHSPYIVEHLQNLILAHDLNDRSEIVDSLYLKREDSFISKENVGVYLFHNGTAENILMDDGEINWQTFCDTANIIGNISSLVYDKKYEESDRLKKTAEMSVAEEEPAYQR